LKIAIVTTHPIQYHAPLFSYLSANSNYSIKVFYTLGNQGVDAYDKDFGIKRNWNLDLLSGYEYEFLVNSSKSPSIESFWNINNPHIIDKIRDYNPNAILVYGWKHYSHFSVLRFFKGKVPILFRGDSTTLDDYTRTLLQNKIKYTFLKWIYKHVDYVLSPGKASDQYFLKVSITKSNIIRVPHSVDNERFSLFTAEDNLMLNEFKKKLFISNNDFVFLFAGKFIHKKNPLLLIKAFEILAKSNNNIKLLLVGNGSLEIDMRRLVNSLHETILNRIVFLPFQNQHQIKIMYRLADVFILPSKGPGETWGLAVNESLASGTPVIVSNKCGCANDLVEHNVNGMIFESNDLLDLVQKMKLFCDENSYHEIKNSVPRNLDHFSFKSFEKELHKIPGLFEN
jgi:glycosyltransferase involved in cell wall biosynthesis